MREHVGLFRGKRLEDGKWIEGSLVRAEDAVFISAKPKCYATCFTSVKDVGSFTEYSISWFFRVAPDTVSECTGLTDRNGKLIFEGDIVSLNGLRFKVKWGTGHYSFECIIPDNYAYPYFPSHAERCEVIGNIHDNQELIGGTDHDKN